MPPSLRLESWIVLIAVFLAASQSLAALLSPDRHLIDWHRPVFYSLTLISFGALVWMALVAWQEGLLRRPVLPRLTIRRRPASTS